MAKGKKSGGRQKGTPNKATAQRQREVAASGEVPLEYLLKVMRDEHASLEARFEAAKAAAPYVHPKLASVEHAGEETGPIQIVLTSVDGAL